MRSMIREFFSIYFKYFLIFCITGILLNIIPLPLLLPAFQESGLAIFFVKFTQAFLGMFMTAWLIFFVDLDRKGEPLAWKEAVMLTINNYTRMFAAVCFQIFLVVPLVIFIALLVYYFAEDSKQSIFLLTVPAIMIYFYAVLVPLFIFLPNLLITGKKSWPAFVSSWHLVKGKKRFVFCSYAMIVLLFGFVLSIGALLFGEGELATFIMAPLWAVSGVFQVIVFRRCNPEVDQIRNQ